LVLNVKIGNAMVENACSSVFRRIKKEMGLGKVW